MDLPSLRISDPLFRSDFSESEIAEMENLFRQVGQQSLSQEFCEELASSFSSSAVQSGKPAVHWKLIQNWFQQKQHEIPGRSNAETSLVLRGGRASELEGLAFEAKSSRDNAWYDVASFLNYRVLSTGELESRVRFAGFSHSHDEWVNTTKHVRQRSVPLEATECERVKVGDLVLCFQERSNHALYVDAHVIEIKKRLHDIKGCRCIFVVRYLDDNIEDKVLLERICRRPTE